MTKPPIYRCHRKKKKCRRCEHDFPKEEKALTECPECGEDRRCMNKVKEEGKACKMHGGRSPKGMAASGYKHGRYSKYLPERYKAKYEAAMGDPDLLEHLPAIHLMDTRIAELIEQLKDDDPIGRLAVVRQVFADLRGAMASGNSQRLIETLDLMDITLNESRHTDETWDRTLRLIERRERLADLQWKKEMSAELNLNAEAMILLAAVESAIYLHIQDRHIIQRIITELETIGFGGETRGTPALLNAG